MAKRSKSETIANASSMRRFDPQLSDAQIKKIAAGIEAAAATGKTLNPKKNRLHNADEPIGPFVVDAT